VKQKSETTAFPVSFRDLLVKEFTQRTKKNSRYSLRAFAALLGTDSSRLSKILRGERPVNPDLIEAFGKKLKLSPGRIESYKTYREVIELKKPAESNAESLRFLQLTQDSFEILADSVHYSLLELMKLKGFRTETPWLANTLNRPKLVIESAIERLVRTGLLEVRENGTWRDLSDGFSTHMIDGNYTSYAHKESQAAILEQALEALENTPIELRDQSSMMMATSPEKIAIAKELIKNFRRELCAFLESAEDKTSIYQLSISLFPITNIDQESTHEKTSH
jgi:uncharacterized protein (TIGR02147 family)